MKQKRLELLLAGLLTVTPIAAQESQEMTVDDQEVNSIRELETPLELNYVTINSLEGLTNYTEQQLTQALGENLRIDLIYSDTGVSDQTITEINSALHLLRYPAPTGAQYSSLMNESLRDFIQHYTATYGDELLPLGEFYPLGVSRTHDEMISEMLIKAIAEGDIVQDTQVELVPVIQQSERETQRNIQHESPQGTSYVPIDCDTTEFESLKPYIDPQAPYDLDDVLSLYPIGISYIPCTEYGPLWNLLGLSEEYDPETHARAVAEYQLVHDQEITYLLSDIVSYLNFENLVQESYRTIVQENTSDKEYLRKLSWLLRREEPLDSISTANSSHERNIVEFTNHLNLDRSVVLTQEIRDAIDRQLSYNLAVELGYLDTERFTNTNLYRISNDDFRSLQNLQAYTTLVSSEDLDVSQPSNRKSILMNFYDRHRLLEERLVPDHVLEHFDGDQEPYRVGPDSAY